MKSILRTPSSTAWLLLALLAVGGPMPAEGVDRFGRSAADLEAESFLRVAEIAGSEEVGEGITHPLRLTLRRDDLERRAIYKTVDEEINEVAFTNTLESKFTDRYRYEVAAYLVDRMLGIGLVPATVLRTVDGVEGSVQLWIEDITTMERALEQHGNEPVANFDLLLERLMLTYILDALIYNIDRNHTNILVDFSDDRFHPIDHSRAFRLYKKLPPMRDTQIRVPDGIATRLRGLDLESWQAALGELLEPAQIKAVEKRRRLLVKKLESLGLM